MAATNTYDQERERDRIVRLRSESPDLRNRESQLAFLADTDALIERTEAAIIAARALKHAELHQAWR